MAGMSEIELALAGSCNVMSDVRELSSSSLSVRSNRYAPSRHNQIVLGFGLVTCVKWYQGSSANRGVACVRRRCGRVQVGRDSGDVVRRTTRCAAFTDSFRSLSLKPCTCCMCCG